MFMARNAVLRGPLHRPRSGGGRLALALGVALSSGCALAQGGPSPNAPAPLRAQYEALFQQTLRDPGNLDASFRFAEVASAIGDQEAAIGALERMLFFNPQLARVKLELGVLYFRLGSYEMARSYFNAAVEAPDTPTEVRLRVAQFQSEIDRRLRTTQFSGFFQAGLRYQSNANAGPNGIIVRALGQDATLATQFRRQGDWNAFVLGGGRFIYDFGNQRGDVFEADVIGFYSKQFKIDRLDTGLFEIQAGPRFALLPDAWPGSSIKPYLVAGAISLGSASYLRAWGAGVTLALPFTYALVEPGYEVRQRDYDNSEDYPTAKDQSGRFQSGYLRASGPLHAFGTTLVRWQFRGAYNVQEARAPFTGSRANAYRQWTADLAFPWEFEASFLPQARRWTVSPFVGYSHSKFEEPNPIVDPLIARRDREWRVGASFDMPLTDAFGLAGLISYSHVNSSLPNYEVRNFTVSFGPTGRF
jgi:hypothetical protein